MGRKRTGRLRKQVQFTLRPQTVKMVDLIAGKDRRRSRMVEEAIRRFYFDYYPKRRRR